MQNNDFCVFILSHGRPDNVRTYRTLQRLNYTGKLFIIVDNEDTTADKYIATFGKDKVIIFDKKAMADSIDEGNNFDNRKVIVHARNVCFEIAKKMGITYFIQLDDDYDGFYYRMVVGDDTTDKSVKDMGNLFDIFLDYYKSTNALSIAFAQGGDYIGGNVSGKADEIHKRKCMNSFFCSTKKEFRFVGSINEDVNTYTLLGSRGNLFLTIPLIALKQAATQSQSGGMSDIYKDLGTYIKSFTTILMHPSSVIVGLMQCKFPRLHHKIKWKNTVPVIIEEKYKK
jgi:hypothetical protein